MNRLHVQAYPVAWHFCSGRRLHESGQGNGITMHIVTDTPTINTIGYPTCKTWSRDSRSLFVESSRPRPDGTKIAFTLAAGPNSQVAYVDISGVMRELLNSKSEARNPKEPQMTETANLKRAGQGHLTIEW